MPSNMPATCKTLREKFGLMPYEMADALGLSRDFYNKFEASRGVGDYGELTARAVDKFRDKFDIDLHVADWAWHGDINDLPKSLRWMTSKLTDTWEKDLREKIQKILMNL